MAGASLIFVISATFPAPAAASSCTTVSTSKGPLTAAVVVLAGAETVTGTVGPMGCDIGVYFGPGTSGTIDDATISGFVEYGVFNDGGNVTVENSTISDIGDTPFDGVQYGVGVYFVNPQLNNPGLASSPATGTISGNMISQYQKGGITVNGSGSSAAVTDNTVTGLGPASFIAQNGIQFGFGASVATVTGNHVSGNIYTEGYAPPGYVSAGFLFYDAANITQQNTGQIASTNRAAANQCNICVVG